MKPPSTRISINALADQTGHDRRSIKKHLGDAGLKPDKRGTFDRGKALVALETIGKKHNAPLRDQKLSEEIRKLRIKNDRDESKVVALEQVRAVRARIASQVDQVLEQKLCNEYPSAVAGLDVPQARVYGKRLGDQIRSLFGEMEEQWP